MQRESECSMLAQCLITRGDMTAWRGMCGKAELEWADQWYKPRGGGVLGLMCRWVCAAGPLEPLLHYSLFFWPIIDPILVTFWKM